MHVVYSSPYYHIVENPDGIELIDKQQRMGAYLRGDAAMRFRHALSAAVAEDPTVEHVDEFLHGFGGLMQLPAVYH